MNHLTLVAGVLLLPASLLLLLAASSVTRGRRFCAELASIAYIGFVGSIASATGVVYIMFPELGALAHDVFGRPRGRWARSPILLAATPVLTAAAGTLITRNMSYGLASVLLAIGCAVLVVRVLKSPLSPAISAGLLPLVLGVRSWWYPPAVLFGTALLATASALRAKLGASFVQAVSQSGTGPEDSNAERRAHDCLWVPWFGLFLLTAYAGVVVTGWRFLLYPPLVVTGFEMFAHTDRCPWAGRPLLLPVACFLTAACGMGFFMLFGSGIVTAAASMACGALILSVRPRTNTRVSVIYDRMQGE